MRVTALTILLAAALPAQQWLPQSPSPNVTLDGPRAAYIASTNRALAFSQLAGDGCSATSLRTYELQRANGLAGTPGWTAASPTGAQPSARHGHSVVYRPQSNRAIVFAGSPPCVELPRRDIWVLTGASPVGINSAWLQLDPTGLQIPSRQFHAAALDEAGNRMIVFGGGTASAGGELNDVWVLSNADGTGGAPIWTRLFPSGTLPAGRISPLAFYHVGTNSLVVYGGQNAGGFLDQAWVLSGANGFGTPQWTQLQPAGPSPGGPGNGHYDSASNRLFFVRDSDRLLFVLEHANGQGGAPQWSQVQPAMMPGAPYPPARTLMTSVFAYDDASNRLILAGGDAAPAGTLNDMWILTDAPGRPVVNYTVATSPAGRTVTVDGVGVTSPAAYNWIPSSVHSLNAPSPQSGAGARYTFLNWSDGGQQSRTVVLPASSTTYTANYSADYLLSRIVSPQAGGTLTANPPSETGYYDAGTPVQLTAVANPGYFFTGFSGDPGGTANPQTVVMNGPRTVTANFTSGTCSYTISPSVLAASSQGSVLTAQVTAPVGCSWFPAVDQPWVAITSGQQGTGNGSITLQVQGNPSAAARGATLTVSGRTAAISQSGAPCRVSIAPPSAGFPAAGGDGAIDITSPVPDCPWTASRNATWIQLLTAPAGTGAGLQRYRVTANTAASQRSGLILINGIAHRVDQAGSAPCTYSLSQSSAVVTASGGTGSVFLATQPGCPFTASSNAAFVSITSSASGSGAAEVRYQVTPNPGSGARYAALAVGGKQFVILQTGRTAAEVRCTLSAAPAIVRDLGRAELLGEATLTCEAPAATAAVTGTVTVALNAALTSRVLDAGTRTTEAMLIPASGAPVMGILDGPNSVRFPFVTLVPAGGGVRTFRIVNLRADAATAPSPIVGLARVSSLSVVSMRNNVQPLGEIAPGLNFTRGTAAAGPSSGQFIVPLFYQEGAPGAFKLRVAGANGESGVVSGAAGLADTATRLRVRVSNLPGTAQVYATTSSESGGVQLVSANEAGVGGAPVPGSSRAGGLYGQLTVSAGVATGTWEVANSDANSLESHVLRLLVEGVTTADLANIQVEGALAPVSAVGRASAIAPIPRFRDPRQPVPLVNLRIAGQLAVNSRPVPLRQPTAGSNVTFTQTITNDATETANNVTAQGNLPAGLSLVNCATTAGACGGAGNDVVVTIPSLAAGTEAVVTITARVEPSVPPGTVIEFDVSAGGDESDSDLLNNRSSTSFTVTGGCAYAFSRQSFSVGASGGMERLDVTAPPFCGWSANSTVDWVTPMSTATVMGAGTLRFRVAANTAGTPRPYSLDVAGLSVVIVQAAAACKFGASASATNIPAAGGTYTLTVTGPAGCEWTATAAPEWLTFGGVPPGGAGNGSVGFNVAANLLALPRTGTITVGGETVQIVQQRSGAAPPVPPFSDVPPAHAYSDHISLLREYAVTSGCSANAYCPDGATTRGQMAVFLVRSVMGGDNFTFPATPYFTDVPASHPYFKYVQKMRELGITSGCTATAYCPDAPVTRGQMGVFLIRGRLGIAAGASFPYPATPYFADIPVTHPYFAFLQKMRELSVTTGCTTTNYCDGDLTTRGQMAVFLIRAFFTP